MTYAKASALLPLADWLVLGTRMNIEDREKCVVFASDTLTMAEFRSALGLDTSYGTVLAPTFIAEYEVACTMRNIRFVFADTYAEAMAKLFADWQPSEPDRQALPVARKALGS